MKSIFSFMKEVTSQSEMIVSRRLWNIIQDNTTNIERKRNRKLLDVNEKAFDLEYKIEEKVVPGCGVEIVNRLFINQDYF